MAGSTAKAETGEKAVEAPKVKFRYFRNPKFAGLSVVVDNTDELDKYRTLRFIPRVEKFQGDDVRVGYLRVEEGKDADKVAQSPGTVEIEQKEFEGK